jgi:uncharacterized protein YcfJ
MRNIGPYSLLAAISLASSFAHASRIDDDVEYARVLSSEPIYQTHAYSQPREQCWNEQVPVRASYEQPRSYTAPILGAIIGGAIGNALGHHEANRKVGTVAGAALGASVGRDISYRNSGGYQPVAYTDEQVCRTVADRAYREEVVGYRVRYRYHGHDYVTEMPYDPGPRLPVHIDVEPAHW